MSRMENGPDIIVAGASRCGSTWLHRALDNHPEIAMAEQKPLNFFDVGYQRGLEWYADCLPDETGVLIGESSPGYMKHPYAPERIAETVPDARLVFTVRDPVDRAFSEWWHERTLGKLNIAFDNVLEHHPAFDMVVRPGFYDRFLDRFERHFDDDQMKLAFFEEFTEDNEAFAQDIYGFLGVDDEHTPSLVGERVNEADHLGPSLAELKSWVYHNSPDWLYESVLEPGYQPVKRVLESDSAYKRGVPDDVRAELEATFLADICGLEERTGRDLSHWYEHCDTDCCDSFPPWHRNPGVSGREASENTTASRN